MPTVTASARVPGVPPEAAWSVIVDPTRYCEFADPNPSVSIEGHEEHWTVLLNGSRVDWSQIVTPREGATLSFTQTRGDLAGLNGTWRVTPDAAGGSEIGVVLSFFLGVDGLAPLLDPIWTQSFQAHADAMVRAVHAAAIHRGATP